MRAGTIQYVNHGQGVSEKEWHDQMLYWHSENTQEQLSHYACDDVFNYAGTQCCRVARFKVKLQWVTMKNVLIPGEDQSLKRLEERAMGQ